MEQDKVPHGWSNNPASYWTKAWQNYRINRESFQAIWDYQQGKCAGCEESLAHPTRKSFDMGLKPQIDHDHTTGKVRGLLCGRCNNFLGKIRDNRKTLQNLVQYLKRNGEVL